jgi:hypothetical protein
MAVNILGPARKSAQFGYNDAINLSNWVSTDSALLSFSPMRNSYLFYSTVFLQCDGVLNAMSLWSIFVKLDFIA